MNVSQKQYSEATSRFLPDREHTEMDLPAGFRYAGVSCGIKQVSDRKDLTLVVADEPIVAAGVYTQNKIVAAPVVLSRSRTPSSSVRAVVINSGNANACTGQQGTQDAEAMAKLTAEHCDIDPKAVLVMSTGVIGHVLPMELVSNGIAAAAKSLANDSDHFHAAADGIMTTDIGRKTAFLKRKIAGTEITFAAMAKGAGMIGPNMATMLGLVMCDAKISSGDAQKALKAAVDDSFNAISVDGHTSTNDTVNLLCSGTSAAIESPQDVAAFTEALMDVCIELAKQIPADGEGAEHLVEINVTGAECRADARRIAKTVADSPLVKTAVTGNDPNWGRIMSAAGYADVPIQPQNCSLAINGLIVFRDGGPVAYDEKEISQMMASADEVIFDISVGDGPGTARFWTSDLTTKYVEFNSEYTT